MSSKLKLMRKIIKMWTIIKIDRKKIFTLKKEFFDKIGKDVKFYSPKIKLKKYFNSKILIKENYLLGDYLLCFHENFKKNSVLSSLQYCIGLKYFLKHFNLSQLEIKNFISRCKENEDKDGFIKQSFFNFKNKKKFEFMSGPFTNLIFSVLEENKISIKGLIGKHYISVSKESNLFRPV